jgi:hypothetical protein
MSLLSIAVAVKAVTPAYCLPRSGSDDRRAGLSDLGRLVWQPCRQRRTRAGILEGLGLGGREGFNDCLPHGGSIYGQTSARLVAQGQYSLGGDLTSVNVVSGVSGWLARIQRTYCTALDEWLAGSNRCTGR